MSHYDSAKQNHSQIETQTFTSKMDYIPIFDGAARFHFACSTPLRRISTAKRTIQFRANCRTLKRTIKYGKAFSLARISSQGAYRVESLQFFEHLPLPYPYKLCLSLRFILILRNIIPLRIIYWTFRLIYIPLNVFQIFIQQKKANNNITNTS